jgi:monoterpene epsilon-lactone hydrolase
VSSWQASAFSHVIRAIVRRRDWGDERALAIRARRVFGAPRAYGWMTTIRLKRAAEQSGPVRGEWLSPRNPRPGVVLYVHGGGFVSCSPATHRPIAAALARLTRRRVFSVDYRLAPEARLPAANEDVATAYAWLISTGFLSSEIALAGDSAGGNLVLSLAVILRDRKEALPACVVAFSPWTDLTGESPSVRGNAERCAMFYPENMNDFATAALGTARPNAPRISPAFAALHDLPPVLLHVGSTELLRDDARRMHEGIRESGGASTLRVFDDVPHGWQMLFPFVPEAGASLREAAAFIDTALSAGIAPEGLQ